MSTRRALLKMMGFGVLAAGALSLPLRAFAAWNKRAFDEAKTVDSLSALTGDANMVASDRIDFKAPEIAENGAAVPLSVSTDLPNVESISIYAVANPRPMVAYFTLSGRSVADVSTRIKLGKTGDVTAVVRAGGKNYFVTKEVKVTIGGCGG